jgi:hypothetical protein
MIGFASLASSAMKPAPSASARPAEPQRVGGGPAVLARRDDRVRAEHRRRGDDDRAEDVDALVQADALVLDDQRAAQHERREADREG